MKVLLLHPREPFGKWRTTHKWDLVVDIGRAPSATYSNWSRQTGCPVVSLYDHAEEIEDLCRLRDLLRLGIGRVVDRHGIDWWDIFSLEIGSGLHRIMLIHRLAKTLPANCDLYSSQPNGTVRTLQRLLGTRVTCLGGRLDSVHSRVHRYYDAVSRLDPSQIFQVLEDKLDADHAIRRWFANRRSSTGEPVILLPSAYVNTSRLALSYASQLPHQQFLLVVARRNGYPATVPSNTRVASLIPYFEGIDKRELASLLVAWGNLKSFLAASASEFKTAEAEGLFGSAHGLVGWGIALRDAWLRVFASENVTACFSADDSNPNTRIPLILSRQKDIPSLACHHGALDYRMAIKKSHAAFYLAKNQMERDYLQHVCSVETDRIVIASPVPSKLEHSHVRLASPWLVFFTEPYQSYGWRSDEVYRELLPRLCSLAQACKLKLVFKLHPFESVQGHRRMLRRLAPEQEPWIGVIAGPPSNRLWNNTRFAITVQSSTALECAALGIPIFLCAWLRDPFSGYVQQFSQFGVGQVLDSPEQLDLVPKLLERRDRKWREPSDLRPALNSADLTALFSGVYSALDCNTLVASQNETQHDSELSLP